MRKLLKLKEVKGHKGYLAAENGQILCFKGKLSILKEYKTERNDKPSYSSVCIDGEIMRVHTIIAEAFPEICGEKKEGYEIDHRNGNKRDNRASNLRYVTHKDNLNNPVTKHKIGRKKNRKEKPIFQYTLSGLFLGGYDSISDAAEENMVWPSSISEAANGKRKTAGGYRWCYSRLAQLP